ncbi:Truncated hydrogenase nickel incorporation protein [Mycobacterium tuberculosis]|nr:Truncated hydrogenase nickel incorporation protein [Mycobacterium tuberculosis]
MVSSVTEGKDKPLMYPATFRSRDVVLLDKIDLVPFLDADVDAYIAHVREVNAAATILPTSTRTGAGMGPGHEPPETARLIGFHGEATAAEMDNVDRLPGLTAIRL